MSVQIQPARPKDQFNGLESMEADILKSTGEEVTAVVTYFVKKVTTDVESGESYPVMRMKHIEPIRTAEALEQVRLLAAAAYTHRTGETELDFSFDPKAGD